MVWAVVLKNWHRLVPGARDLQTILAFLVDFDNEVIVLGDELVHYLTAVESKIGD